MTGASRTLFFPQWAVLIFLILTGLCKSGYTQDIKPRILIIFDTSGSMQSFIDSDEHTKGDGSWDAWGDRFCCPGAGNSRMYHAKEAVRQMVFATGDIDFALMKYAQEYTSTTDLEQYFSSTIKDFQFYKGNQSVGVADKLRYGFPSSNNDCRDFEPYDPFVPGSAYEWLCVEFPEDGADSRGAVMMWMDHHEFNSDGTPDVAPVFEWSRAGDGFEQELRATTFTPLAGSMRAAETYLEAVYDADYSANASTARCRPYSVILLTDGDEYCERSDDTAIPNSSLALSELEDGSDPEAKSVSIWPIGFGLDSFSSDLDTIAQNGGTGYARTATSQAELSGVLYEIVSASLLVEICNNQDDDCDGQVDEDFRPDRTYCNTDNDDDDGVVDQPGTCNIPSGDEVTEDILCSRPPECACDGIDNNCDGETDEPPEGENSWPVLENACGGCVDDANCADPEAGRCERGDLVCIPGQGMICMGSVEPRDETCNGLDDDCDGVTDEGIGETCGPCGDGNWYCVGGTLQCCAAGTTLDECVPITLPKMEDCNGLDDDCDGETDEQVSATCGGCDSSIEGQEYCEDPNEGVCAEGSRQCVGGVWEACAGEQGPSGETCNNQDDDCDGLTDEELMGATCGTCGDGNIYCLEGGEQCCAGLDIDGACVPVQIPSVEVCNGIDDDCNGETDEGIPPRECMDSNYVHLAGIGICNKGYQQCIGGVWGNDNPETEAFEEGYCKGQQLPTTETCNLVDDNCDGQTDEDIVGKAGCGPCKDGQEECINGILQCTGARTPGEEICNGVDDDCDNVTDEYLNRTCFSGTAEQSGVGVCHEGMETCQNGEWGFGEGALFAAGVCGNEQLPQGEQCDCLDNDCDGETDEFEDLGDPIGKACNACGVWECRECKLVCSGIGEAEECDGEDNNCNGVIDEGFQLDCGGCVQDETTETLEDGLLDDCLDAQAADGIGPDEGECRLGVRVCDPKAENKWSACEGYVSPAAERCDNKDNDCDGVTDEPEDIDLVDEVCATEMGQCEAAWWRCVENETGGRSLECCASVTEDGVCVSPLTPTLEICNGLDDDCNGEIDDALAEVGVPCGESVGVCSAGTVQCVCDGESPQNCSLTCVGATEGSDEVCNGLDDDCDGDTDEDIPLGKACTNSPGGVPSGECDRGYEQCINGEWSCNANLPGDEICDGLDNDCDGTTDEELVVACPKDSWCIEGVCASECAGEELACIGGMTCMATKNGLGDDVRVCLTDVCDPGSVDALPCADNPYWCDEGQEPKCKCSQEQKKCVSICNDILCPEGTTCVPRTGRCETIEDDCYAKGCPAGQICTGGVCAEDPCSESCPSGMYCNQSGKCVASCAGLECPSICHEGKCVDKCENVSCDDEQVCNPYTGECEPTDACENVNCKFYEICEAGKCIEDPCFNISCPNGFVCIYGSCHQYAGIVVPDNDSDNSDDSDSNGPGGTDTDSDDSVKKNGMHRVLATGMGGCMCHSVPGAPPRSSSWLIFVMVALAWVTRVFRHRPFVMGVLLLGMLLGCQTDPFELVQSDDDTSTNGSDVGDETDSNNGNYGTDTNGCNPNSKDDDCDGVDDNCNGDVDEGVDFENNANHCGTCDNDCTVKYVNAFGVCREARCEMGECAPFYQDINGKSSDGCEYFCQKRSEDDRCNGVDLNDGEYVGVDDNCDGRIDENADLDGDPFNCGRCGHVCVTPHGKPDCVDGTCTVKSCEDGFSDVDGKVDNGCEYQCEGDGEVETCNGKDDDCNGEIDEGNPGGGGVCYTIGTGCVEQDGSYLCEGRCKAGKKSCVDGQLICVDQVVPLPVESCNNIDDDCDGETDESLARACRTEGSDYKEVGACLMGSQICVAGKWGPCEAEILPSDEKCDGVDNDCDGETDESPIDVGEPCGGSTVSLNQDPNEGACAQGVTICQDAVIVCDGAINPVPESCDGLDNDCDGITDNNILGGPVCGGCDPDVYDYCIARDQGLCEPGLRVCQGGEWGECKGSIGPVSELCDGFDNDCDGNTDVDSDGNPVTGGPCGTCGGIEHCLNKKMSCCLYLDDEGNCVAPGAATGETCNGIDDDCDGVTDNNLVQTLCDGDDADLCAEGIWVCENGQEICSDLSGDSQELCDGLDNDCDGQTDEDLTTAPKGWCNEACRDTGALVGTHCSGTGGWVCEYNCAVAEAHAADEVQCDNGQVVSAETWCNGLDDDCDGLTDENLTSTESHCGACGNDCWDFVSSEGHVASMACVNGACRINACEAGYWDLDGNLDGEFDCEYGSCTRVGTEGTVCNGVDDDCDGLTDNGASTIEICDGVDNDCDGQTDEIEDLKAPDLCNSKCPNPATHQVKCLGEQGWKCDYACIGEAGGSVECVDQYTLAESETLCDGLDNDCDGTSDEGFALWGEPAILNARCTSNGMGACSLQGWVKCNAAGDGFDCCASNAGAICDAANIIVENPERLVDDEASLVPNGIDDDCDGVVDDGADGCIDIVHIAGIETGAEYDMFAYEASRRNSAQAPCSETDETTPPIPWTNISFDEARAACRRLNTAESNCSIDENTDRVPAGCWDLCSAEQWYYGCAYWGPLEDAPRLYPYSDVYSGSACNGIDKGVGNVMGTGEAADCSAEWGPSDIWDLSGNVEEWTLDLRTVTMFDLNGDAYEKDLRVIRGGSYKTVENGMSCRFDFFAADETSLQMDQIGFRCCRGVDPISVCENALAKIPNHPFDFNVTGNPIQCSQDGWWTATDDSATRDEESAWEVGMSTAASAADNCVFGTHLNGNYTDNHTSYLYSAPFDFGKCVGSAIQLSYKLLMDMGSGDSLSVHLRSRSDGESFGSWSPVQTVTSSTTDWESQGPLTLVSTPTETMTYQLRFVFTADSAGNGLGAYIDDIELSEE